MGILSFAARPLLGIRDLDVGQELLKLLENPFVGQQLQQTSVYTSLATSLGITVGIALAFSFLRPYNQTVYAPKLKHADEKHAPPPIVGKQPWAWVTPLWKMSEEELIHHVGMDATVFLRFTRMCRNMFLVLSLVGCCILAPIHLTQSVEFPGDDAEEQRWLLRMTPSNVRNDAMWGQVVAAYLFNIIVAGFLWWNYRKICMLRRKYFEDEEYRTSLHARTLMMTNIPRDKCSDEGIAAIIDSIVPNSSFARTAIARNVKDLPSLIDQHGHAVRKLEKVLAKYLKNPDRLPPERPLCRPSKKDPSFSTYPKDQKLDAIDYLTQRIKSLELEVREVRASVDRRSTMPYGFASYSDITEAHNIAYACRRRHPSGASICLAPRPNDIIWDNMALIPRARRVRRWVNFLWVSLLTVLWIAPNAMIAIFLVNLSNLGKVWPDFQTTLQANTGFWGAVQGILSPALLSTFYLVLPVIFRRLSIKAGDRTKTGRERHVIAKLYNFFVINNLLIFTFFSTLWGYVSGFVKKLDEGGDPWSVLSRDQVPQGLFLALCTISPFWITWLLQRQLGAAIDLVQLWPLVYGFFMKRFSHPTPRELIELTAPPPFEYASYYNYFLYYSTVALFFAGIQPLVLPAAALYFAIDVFLKKYLILYVFVTKTESGGLYWKVLFNRLVFAAMLGNCVVFLTTWARGYGTHTQSYAVVPLPFFMLLFKLFCRRAFDNRILYFSTRNAAKHPEAGITKEPRLRSERLAHRFGHPALYKQLITPMVHQKAQNVLHTVYKGRLSQGGNDHFSGPADDIMSVSGYSDSYALDNMAAGKPGKTAHIPGFEFVAESRLDFEHYKNRPEFASEHGGAAMYGGCDRPGTPSSLFDSEFGSRPSTPVQGGYGGRRVFSGGSDADFVYPPSPSVGRSPTAAPPPGAGPSPLAPDRAFVPRNPSPLYSHANDSSAGLVRGAAPLATPTALGGGGASGDSRDGSMDGFRAASPAPVYAASALGGFVSVPLPGTAPAARSGGYAGVPQSEEEGGSGFDYFRAPRRKPGTPSTPGTPGSSWQG